MDPTVEAVPLSAEELGDVRRRDAAFDASRPNDYARPDWLVELLIERRRLLATLDRPTVPDEGALRERVQAAFDRWMMSPPNGPMDYATDEFIDEMRAALAATPKDESDAPLDVELTDKVMGDIAAAMPWYDESNPDYTEARDAILAALPHVLISKEELERLRTLIEPLIDYFDAPSDDFDKRWGHVPMGDRARTLRAALRKDR